jgi:hypothetical protein
LDEAEVALSMVLLAVIVGVRKMVTTKVVAMALKDVHKLVSGSFSVHCHCCSHGKFEIQCLRARYWRRRTFGCCSGHGRGELMLRPVVSVWRLRLRVSL